MKTEIDRALATLDRLPLWGAGRESNMLVLHFGERRSAPTRDEPGREVGSSSLHVFCAWRLARASTILAASGDLFTPADPDEDLDTFDYEAPGATWWDVRLAGYLVQAATPPIVVRHAVDALGGFALTLSDDTTLEVFPNSAPTEHFETEFWRLLRPGAGEAPLVVGTSGLHRG